MITAYHNNKDIVDLLINCGAKINSRHKSGKTALHLTSMKANVECNNFVLEKGTDVNDADNNGNTALHRCCQ